MKVLIVIPAYNEAESIVSVIDELKEKCPQFDYVIINDGSSDGLEDICRANNFNYITHPVNLGLAGAVQTGMKYALKNGYDAVIQLDGDGQHEPQYIPLMADKLCEGYNIVIGSRFVNSKKPHSLRMFGNNLIEFVIKLVTGQKITDPTSGMRMYDASMIKKFALAVDLAPEPDSIAFLIRKGAKVCEIPVEMRERMAGKSYLNFSNSVNYMLKMFVSILILQWFRKG